MSRRAPLRPRAARAGARCARARCGRPARSPAAPRDGPSGTGRRGRGRARSGAAARRPAASVGSRGTVPGRPRAGRRPCAAGAARGRARRCRGRTQHAGVFAVVASHPSRGRTIAGARAVPRATAIERYPVLRVVVARSAKGPIGKPIFRPAAIDSPTTMDLGHLADLGRGLYPRGSQHGVTDVRNAGRHRLVPLRGVRIRRHARRRRTQLPACPGCSGSTLRAGLAVRGRALRAQRATSRRAEEREALIDGRARALAEPGEYLAWRDGDTVRVVGAGARVDAHRPQPRRRRPLRRPDRLPPPRADRPSGRRRPRARRPQPQRRLRQRRARRVARARGRRRDRRRPLPPAVPRGRRPSSPDRRVAATARAARGGRLAPADGVRRA